MWLEGFCLLFGFCFFFSPKMNLYLISVGILTFSCKCFEGFFGILSRQLWQVILVFWISNTYRTEYNEFSLVSTQNLKNHCTWDCSENIGILWYQRSLKKLYLLARCVCVGSWNIFLLALLWQVPCVEEA